MPEVDSEVLARRLLGEGQTVEDVVEATGLEPLEVTRIAGQMRAAGALRTIPVTRTAAQAGAAVHHIHGRPTDRPAPGKSPLPLPRPRPAIGRPAPVVVTSAAAGVVADTVAALGEVDDALAQLLDRAGVPPRAAAKLKRARGLVAAATDIVTADGQKAALRGEIHLLEEQLAAKRAALRGSTDPAPSTKPVGEVPSAPQLRAWAASAGVDCPDKGRVPRRVVDAWTAAHPGGDA